MGGTSAPSFPFVTIAVPSFCEERYIEACLRGLLAQDYPRDRIEIIVADGRSTDGTRAIVSRLALEDPRVILVDNPDRLQAAGLNAILRRSRGDVIVRADVHAEYATDFVRRAVEVLEETGADNAGGAQRARAITRFQRALCAALQSPLAVGGARYRGEENEGFVDTVFLGAFRRRVFERIGMYDPRAVTNEDAELNQRIVESGGRIYLSRKIIVHYFPRDSRARLAEQYRRYGQGRARTLLKHGKFLTVRPAIPFLMVMGGSALFVLAPPAFAAAAGSYVALTGIEAIRRTWREDPTLMPAVWSIFPVLHVSHGIGFAQGLLRYLRAPDWSTEERLDPLDPSTREAAPASP